MACVQEFPRLGECGYLLSTTPGVQTLEDDLPATLPRTLVLVWTNR